ncbi:bifunctional helix-turn-helix transcriptional regulator/GNAT family N-acetyltransferase [Bailinhaonella thermotolerans]|uniref:MarR family transcriptional regulator n=1 Tax=Bailinhaonella thermotolerans TaxID=1070861 RepID=A0A3A4BII6_9ACTN|nr:helix-turn-helix domain-containing GNAT family N-acetyltransferase [Bailinhaonella thermotolerans]RJL34652.1 MarR family transcriptional regulator [Bailinhaonella thermotolerans]
MRDVATVTAVREFTRFYTQIIGVLQAGLLRTPYSVAEARVLFELGQRPETEVVALRAGLGLDAGYLSRMLARFEADGLVARQRSEGDARRQVIRLTRTGREVYRTLDERSAAEVGRLIEPLPEEDRRRLTGAMATIRDVLRGRRPPAPDVKLRAPGPGELGWVVQRHGALYAEEYGWDATFEALVARIVADFAAGARPGRDAAWIAEVDGEPAGCVFCVEKDESTAQLRLLLVEPARRGLGLGGALVDECVAFARGAGYERMVLWTNDCLTDARRIYERAGFELTRAEPHRSFGADLVGQYWTLAL